MLLKKMVPTTCSIQDCHEPSICKKKKNAVSMKNSKMRLACILFSPRDICLLVPLLEMFSP